MLSAVLTFVESTRRYEAWLGAQIPLVAADLEHKHQAMAEALFPFMRATFYRWAEQWPALCPELALAPQVLTVGDLHIENFGTWRDREGRLVWGVNDFDEAHPAAYTVDLVRLATSAQLAIGENHLAIEPKEACAAILGGYRQALKLGGQPLILESHHSWLRRLVAGDLRDPQTFWDKLMALPTLTSEIPSEAQTLLLALLPEPTLPYRLTTRLAGLGSLGRQRFVALAEWRGGPIAREAKALVPSAWIYSLGLPPADENHYEQLVAQAVRCPDPLVRASRRWVVRRLAPDCCRVELGELGRAKEECRLLEAMGFEVANLHLGSGSAVAEIAADLEHRPSHFLSEASDVMAHALKRDWDEWRKRPR